jgi:hypothetical protein
MVLYSNRAYSSFINYITLRKMLKLAKSHLSRDFFSIKALPLPLVLEA